MGTPPHLTRGYTPADGAATESAGAGIGLNRKGRGGFTLVEIMIVVVIIGLLAALAIPTFTRVKIKSQAARMANDFRQYEAAFQRFSMENGSLPGSAAASAIPAGMTGYLADSYTQNSPLGGTYEWLGAPDQNIVLSGTYATDEVMLMVDKTLDDGDLATGDFTKPAAATFSYHIH
jgi:prepilin-type N-terminal cleavage/methylation domain-containing protein